MAKNKWTDKKWGHTTMGQANRGTKSKGSYIKWHYWGAKIWQGLTDPKTQGQAKGRNNKTYISKASMQVLWGKSCTKAMSSIWENMYWLWKSSHFQKVCMSKRKCTVHEVEIEMAPEPNEGEIETVSINSTYLNRNRSLITGSSKNTGLQNHYRDTIQNWHWQWGKYNAITQFPKNFFKICQWNNLRGL